MRNLARSATKLSARSVSTGEVVSAIPRTERPGWPRAWSARRPGPPGTVFTMSVNTKGRLKTEEEFRRHHRAGRHDRRLRDPDPRSGGGSSLSAGTYALAQPCSTTRRRWRFGIFQAPRVQRAWAAVQPGPPSTMERLKAGLSSGRGLPESCTTRPSFVRTSISKVIETPDVCHPAGGAGGGHIPADLARLDHPRCWRFRWRWSETFRRAADAGLFRSTR